MGMSELTIRSAGQVAYEEYRRQCKLSLTTWDNLSTNVQDVWDAVGDAVIEECVA
jgi:hypothetical protein